MKIRSIWFLVLWVVTNAAVYFGLGWSFAPAPWAIWNLTFFIFLMSLLFSPPDPDEPRPIGPTVGSVAFVLTAVEGGHYDSTVVYVIGSAVCVVGFGLIGWSRACLGDEWRDVPDAPKRLITTGAYRVCRHPLYFGLILIGLGAVIAGGSIVGLIGFLVSSVAYFMQLTEEDAKLSEAFGATYERYCARTRRLVPGIL